MAINSQFFVLIFALFSSVYAQSDSAPLYDPAVLCIPGSGATLTACNNFFTQLDDCTTKTSHTALVDCQCSQSFFNLIVDCESEFRICTGDNSWDSTLEKQISGWHAFCDSGSSIKPTTPVLSSTRAGGLSISTAASTTSDSSKSLPLLASSVTVTKASGSGILPSSTTSTSTSAPGNKIPLPSGIGFGLNAIPILFLAL